MPSGAPAWMVTFADLALLLMAFFILMMSFSSIDLAKYRDVSESMNDAFNDALGALISPLKGALATRKPTPIRSRKKSATPPLKWAKAKTKPARR